MRREVIKYATIVIILFIIWVIMPWEDSIDIKRSQDRDKAFLIKGTLFTSLSGSLDAFEVDIGRYPTSDEGLNALLVCPASVTEKLWRGPYIGPCGIPIKPSELDSIRYLRDPWNNKYRYTYTSDHPHDRLYDIISAGSDGRFGTKDDIKDSDEEVPSCYFDPFLTSIHKSLHVSIFPEYSCRN